MLRNIGRCFIICVFISTSCTTTSSVVSNDKFENEKRFEDEISNDYLLLIKETNSNNWEQASNIYNKIIEKDPNYGPAYICQIIRTYFLNQRQETLNASGKLISLNVNIEEVYNTIIKNTLGHKALIYWWRGNAYNEIYHQTENAIKDIKVSIEINPADCWPYFDLGIIYTDLKKYDDAIDALGKAIDRGAGSHPLRFRGLSYAEKGLYELALQDFNKACENSTDGWNYFYRADFYIYKLNMKDNAIQDYKLAANLGITAAKDRLKNLNVNF
jgi:tetratricopeptide (TPR) repeat protein